MKCPYRDFKDCLVEKCPSCEYETIKYQKIAGRHYVKAWMPLSILPKMDGGSE